MQAVKLGIILVKLAYNKTLDLGCDCHAVHIAPSLVFLEFFHSDTSGNGVLKTRNNKIFRWNIKRR